MTFETIVAIVLGAAGLYLTAGFIFAIPFVFRGVQKVDEGAVGSKWGFRLIIIPGVMVFWPLLLKKWKKANLNRHDEAAA